MLVSDNFISVTQSNPKRHEVLFLCVCVGAATLLMIYPFYSLIPQKSAGWDYIGALFPFFLSTGFGSSNTGSVFGQAASPGGTVFGQVKITCVSAYVVEDCGQKHTSLECSA